MNHYVTNVMAFRRPLFRFFKVPLFFIFLLVNALFSTVFAKPNDVFFLPKEGSTLNFRVVGFCDSSIPQNVGELRMKVAKGKIVDELLFEKAVILSKIQRERIFVEELPEFGQVFTWKIEYKDRFGKKCSTGLHVFSILPMPGKFKESQMVIDQQATQYKDAYIFYDGSKVMYNMKGEPVWFLPNVGSFNSETEPIRDLKETRNGTLTFLGNGYPFEIGFCGNLVWKAPENEKKDENGEGNFHHQFQRLHNGHYMVMGTKYKFCKLCRVGECTKAAVLDVPFNYQPKADETKIPFTTLIEFDSTGNIVWKWESDEYVMESDIFFHPGDNGYADLDAHGNSFCVDTSFRNVFVSFRNLNRVVKVSYPEGEIVGEYGAKFGPGGVSDGIPDFSDQHCVRVSKSGHLIMYNNNKEVARFLPSLNVYDLPKKGDKKLKKLWQFECPVDKNLEMQAFLKPGRHGGEVNELGKNSFFVANCSPFWNMFIVGSNKKLIWSATIKQYNPANNSWEPVDSYRSNILHRKEKLRKLLFRGELEGC